MSLKRRNKKNKKLVWYCPKDFGCNLGKTISVVEDGVTYTHTMAGSPRWERHDCSVIAVSIAADIPYGLAHDMLELHGRKPKSPPPDFYTFLRLSSFKWRRYVKTPISISKFAKLHPKGRFIVLVKPKTKQCHVANVVDGVVYDCCLTDPEEKIHKAWKYEGPKQWVLKLK
jgi:hypothetical protein